MIDALLQREPIARRSLETLLYEQHRFARHVVVELLERQATEAYVGFRCIQIRWIQEWR